MREDGTMSEDEETASRASIIVTEPAPRLLSDTHLHSLLSESFLLLDPADEGSIGAGALYRALRALGLRPTEAEVQDLIGAVDRDGSGRLSFADFQSAMVKNMERPARPEEVKDVCDVFDLEGKGLVTAADLQRVFLTLGRGGCLEEYEEMIAGAELRGENGINLEDMREILNSESEETPTAAKPQRSTKIQWDEKTIHSSRPSNGNE